MHARTRHREGKREERETGTRPVALTETKTNPLVDFTVCFLKL